MAITDLTNTVWYIPAGWTAAAGYEEFIFLNPDFVEPVKITINGTTTNYTGISIGYTHGEEGRRTTLANSIAFINGNSFAISSITNSVGFTITFEENEYADYTETSLISWLQENGTIVNLINFSINTVSYQAEDGMTWEEWVNSSYNTDGYTIGNAMEFTAVQKGNNYITGSSSPSTTLIESDKKYTTNSYAGGEVV